MRWFIRCVCFMMLCAGVEAHTGDVYVAQVASDIQVDGHLSDWPKEVWQKAKYHQTVLATPENEADFKAEFAMMWRDDLLYLAARVTDDVHRCVRVGADIYEGDSVWFSFTPQHESDLWNNNLSWGYGRSSVTDSIMAVPTGRFGRIPRGLTYIDQHVVRDNNAGMTRYEAVVKVPFEMSHGAVYGFDFSATDNDGFRDGILRTSPGTLTFPGNGGSDVLFVENNAKPIRVFGRTVGTADEQLTLVYAFQNDVLKGSSTRDGDGKFEMDLLPGAYQMVAYAGSLCSKFVDVIVGDPVPEPILDVSEKLGTIRGRVVGANGKTPMAYASVYAFAGESLRARVYTNDDGHFSIVDLESGIYDLTCNVSQGDTLKSIEVARGQVVEASKAFTSRLTFDRKPVDDAQFKVLEEWLAYDSNLPLDVERVAKRDVANYVREKIEFASSHDERVVGYLALPKTGQKPFPCLVTMHPHHNPGKDRDDMEMIRRTFTAMGYAVLALDAKYYNERHFNGQTVYDMRRQSYRRRDAYLQTIVDYRRGLDFLATRSEIDTTRIGLYGGSMGATQAMILAPLESRIKAMVLRGPGFSADQWNPSPTDQVHFLPRMGDRPVLIFNGPYDSPWAAQGAQAIVKLLSGETQLIWYETSHTVPPELYLETMQAWVRDNL